MRHMLKAGLPAALRMLPQNSFGDRIYSTLLFLISHQRLPKDEFLFNDVLFRIKTSGEITDPLRVFVSDKEYAKLYVKAVVGERYCVPTIDVIRSVEAIDDYLFPETCCIKPTHAGAGCVILRKHGEAVDRERIKSWFDLDLYRSNREANYRTLRPKIIVEPLIFARTNVEDYKCFCLDGVVKLVQVDVDRHSDHKRALFDTDWNMLDFTLTYPKADRPIPRPANFSEMLDVASRVSAAFGFVRVDLYSDGEHCLVGEITNCHSNAHGRFIPGSAEGLASEIIFGRSPPTLEATALTQALR